MERQWRDSKRLGETWDRRDGRGFSPSGALATWVGADFGLLCCDAALSDDRLQNKTNIRKLKTGLAKRGTLFTGAPSKGRTEEHTVKRGCGQKRRPARSRSYSRAQGLGEPITSLEPASVRLS